MLDKHIRKIESIIEELKEKKNRKGKWCFNSRKFFS